MRRGACAGHAAPVSRHDGINDQCARALLDLHASGDSTMHNGQTYNRLMPADTLHPSFKQPSNSGIAIWRYMDFTKFVAMLESRALYFARTDCLDDAFEGSYPRNNLEARQRYFEFLAPEQREYVLRTLPKLAEKFRRNVFVNCWHMNEHESAAMWRLYGQSDEAVAIKSSYARLVATLDASVHVGVVQYIDYGQAVLDDGNLLNAYLCKRMSFAHEREVRALVMDVPYASSIDLSTEREVPKGKEISVDLDLLIDSIYISPTAKPWLRLLVERVIARYEMDKPVVQSSLNDTPIY